MLKIDGRLERNIDFTVAGFGVHRQNLWENFNFGDTKCEKLRMGVESNDDIAVA